MRINVKTVDEKTMCLTIVDNYKINRKSEYLDPYLGHVYNVLMQNNHRVLDLSYIMYPPYLLETKSTIFAKATMLDEENNISSYSTPAFEALDKVLEYLADWGVTKMRLQIHVDGSVFGCKNIDVRTNGLQLEDVYARCNKELTKKVVNAINDHAKTMGSADDSDSILYQNNTIQIALMGMDKATISLVAVPDTER